MRGIKTDTGMTRTMTSRKRCRYTALRSCIITVTFGTLMSMVFGCALLKKDLVSAGTVWLEEAPSDVAKLSRVHVYIDDAELVVYGRLGRKPGVNGHIDATVRVIVRFPDGSKQEKTTRAFPKYLPIRRSRSSYFNVRFDGLPPAGTIVRVECPPTPSREATFSSPIASFKEKEKRI